MTDIGLARRSKTTLALAIVALFAGTLSSQAEDAWGPLEVIDMTTSSDLTGTVLVSEPRETAEPQPLEVAEKDRYEPILPLRHGWRGSIEVDVDEGDVLSVGYVPGERHALPTREARKVMTGFYTMRYDFKSETAFRPYAGAAVGIVAADEADSLAGGVAARAVAGFDIEVDRDSGFFAEYAFTKSGGPVFAQADTAAVTLPDDEHTLKVGFRRTF